jgi:hypothetical protein
MIYLQTYEYFVHKPDDFVTKITREKVYELLEEHRPNSGCCI